MGFPELVTVIVCLIASIVIHEMAHGYVANWLGDPTARLAGRLSGNPLPHLDPWGSIIIPGVLVVTGSALLFGWAKPVPYNPYNLSNQKWGEAMVAAAGPLSNLLLAVIFAVLIRQSEYIGLPSSFIDLASYVVYINILLACFNLIPFPPLDGSKILSSVLPTSLAFRYQKFTNWVERQGFIFMFAFLFVFIFIFWEHFNQFVLGNIFYALTGIHFQ